MISWNEAYEAAGHALKNDQETIFELSIQLAQAKAINADLLEALMFARNDIHRSDKANGEFVISQPAVMRIDIAIAKASIRNAEEQSNG